MGALGRAGRRLQLALRLAETWVRRPSSPTRAVIDVTRRCNLRCSMCRTWERREHDELSVEELGVVFDGLPRLCWLDLTGGEPLLRTDFVGIVDAALDRLPALGVLHFQTNGWSPERAAAVARRVAARRSEVELIVTVSIDGPPAVHDAIRGRPGSYDRALQTVRALLPLTEVHVGTTVTAANADCFEGLAERLAVDLPELPPSRWHWNFGQRSQHFFGNGDTPGVDGALPPEEARAAVTRHVVRRGPPRDLVALMESVYLINLGAVLGGEPSGIGCQALRSTLFLSPEGDVYPCHIWDRPLGNVRSASIDAIWHSRRVAEARREVEALACGGCFSACEAYPALAGAPVSTALATIRRTGFVAAQALTRTLAPRGSRSSAPRDANAAGGCSGEPGARIR